MRGDDEFLRDVNQSRFGWTLFGGVAGLAVAIALAIFFLVD
jgi:hypothetical protein